MTHPWIMVPIVLFVGAAVFYLLIALLITAMGWGDPLGLIGRHDQ